MGENEGFPWSIQWGAVDGRLFGWRRKLVFTNPSKQDAEIMTLLITHHKKTGVSLIYLFSHSYDMVLTSLMYGTVCWCKLVAMDTILNEEWRWDCKSFVVPFWQTPVCWQWCSLKRKVTCVDHIVVWQMQDNVVHGACLRFKIWWVVAEKMPFLCSERLDTMVYL